MTTGRALRRQALLLLAPSLILAWSCARCGSGPTPGSPAEEHFFCGEIVWNTPTAEDFTLTDQDGAPFRLVDQRGRVVLIFFGFIQCPDVCPATLSTWSKVANRLGDERSEVRFIFITVDPQRDTPERLREHLSIFDEDFLGLSGTVEELETVYESYGVSHRKVQLFDSESGYVVDHTTQTFLVDPQGMLRLRYEFDVRPDDLLADVRWLLDHRSGASPPPES